MICTCSKAEKDLIWLYRREKKKILTVCVLNEAAGKRIHKMGGGIDLILFKDTFCIKTGEKEKGMAWDGIFGIS